MGNNQKLTSPCKTVKNKNMQNIRSKDTKIELSFGKALWASGFRYKKQYKIFGRPDFVLPKHKIALFCDSSYWHGYGLLNTKRHDFKTNREFWTNKILRNIDRDNLVNKTLKEQGWTVLRFWDFEIKNNLEECVNKVKKQVSAESIKYSDIKEKINISIDFKNESTNFELANLTHLLHNIRLSSLSIHEPLETYKYISERISIKELKEELLFKDIVWDVPFPPVENPKFTFIDLFAGVGGFRLAFQNLGGKCVFSSEIDLYARKSYEANFGEVPYGDITKIDENSIPDHDILTGGFPCQAFSIAGKKGGFDDTRGTLFFDVARILNVKRPKAFFLENVKGLLIHDKGKTLKTILRVLREDLDYYVPEPQIMNAKDFGVPQNRERIFIVGFRKDTSISEFEYPEPLSTSYKVSIKDIKEKKVDVKYFISQQYLNTLRKHRERHLQKGNGFGFEVKNDDEIANAIVVGGMGKERNLLYDFNIDDYTPTTNIKGEVNRENIRKMTPREWARLQGFPDLFTFVVADVHLYKQFGNSVAVPAIQATAAKLIEKLRV